MWELMFFKEPWQGIHPLHVTSVVRKDQRLQLSEESPLNGLINDCWESNPADRPSFEQIYERLKGLQQPINTNFEEDTPETS